MNMIYQRLIYTAVWVVAEAVTLFLLFFKTNYYKKLNNLKADETKNNTVSEHEKGLDAFLVTHRKNIRTAFVAIFIIMAGVCGFVEYRFSDHVLQHIKLLLLYTAISFVSVTDFKKYIIPNSVIITVLVTRLLLFIPEFFVYQESFKTIAINCVGAAVLAFVVLSLVSLISKGGFGMGDIKLFACIGFVAGVYSLLNTLIFSLIICAVISGILMISKTKTIKDLLPFGPFIYIGFVISILLGTA